LSIDFEKVYEDENVRFLASFRFTLIHMPL